VQVPSLEVRADGVARGHDVGPALVIVPTHRQILRAE
jgi:hypothetical protein